MCEQSQLANRLIDLLLVCLGDLWFVANWFLGLFERKVNRAALDFDEMPKSPNYNQFQLHF
jgi:hypothetical protein